MGVLVMLAMLLLGAPVARADDRPMNVVLVIIDDLGWADISPNQPETFYRTPRFERLAAEGVNFRRAYAASPVCSPARVSIITGADPARLQTTEWFGSGPARSERMLSADRINWLPNHVPTIAERLGPLGYATSYVGKWHLGGARRHLPPARGFDHVVAAGRQGNPGRDGYFAPYNGFIGLEAPPGEHLPERLTSETISFIRSSHADGPFLAVLSYYHVHTPLAGREDLVTNYHKRAERFDPAAPRFADEEQVWDRAEPRRVRVVQDHPVYAAMVEAVDEQLGRLLDALENMGLEENTVVFVVSDNGGLSTAEGSPTSNLPLRGGKGWLYEGGLRVPLLVRWPGVTEGGPESDTPVHTHDVFASVLDAAGLEAEGTSGVSLRLSMRDRRRDRELFFHYPHYSNQGGFPGGVLIDGDWKLVRRYEDGSLNLYNVRRDPGESTDLAATERRRAQRMARRLDRWLIETGAFPLSARPDGPAPWTPRSDP